MFFGITALLLNSQNMDPSLASKLSGYPYLAESNCKTSAKVPENSGGILFNRDCTVGFVLPETIGRATLTPRPSYSLKLCDQLTNMQEEVLDYNKLITVWKERVAKAPNIDEAKKINAFIEELRESQKKAKQSVDRIEGMRINVAFENRMSHVVNEAQVLNAGDGRTYEPIKIAQGRLQYLVEGAQNDAGIEFNTVLRSIIPGHDHTTDGTQGEVEFGGAVQGEMILTLSGACPFVKKVKQDNVNYLAIDEASLNHTITANYTYAIPVVSSARYTASLDARAALQNIVDRTASTRKFNKNELVDSLVNTRGGQSLKIEISKTELPEGEMNDKFNEMLKENIAERLTAQFLDILAKNNYVTAGVPVFIAPEAKTDTVTSTTRQCGSSSSGPFGIFRSTRCYDVPFTINVDVENRASVFSNIMTTWNIPIEESVEINDIIYRKSTSTFKVIPTQKLLFEVR